ncbi:MAG: 4-hydroxy-tetrahydrodipicolinate synthase [Lentisphaeria bacterium]|nr:4-hydroxy-tetrahydrodipicolinate synthase [Lentisphaeria bacterium]MBR7127341.1 4-hydroxy-tetrahydrodipicolinate synthase [Lentisphaeria bacterium]
MNFQGVYTALVTPFVNDQVDYETLGKLLEMQVAGNVAGIVPVGTTGESPTLSTAEHLKVIEFVIEKVNKRCQIIAGTGANSTAEAVELTIEAKKMGADATLQVTPYYNKPTQEGLYRHFMTVAEKAELPIVLYNVPGRSGVAIAEDNVARMAKANPMIQAIKEAAGSVERVSKLLDICDIQVLSGDDALTLPMMSVGAKGIISVASNIIPAEMSEMVNSFLQGDVNKAMTLHKKYYGLFRDQFIETNPIPIKAAMAMADLIEESYRLPLCEMGAANREKLRNTLIKCGIIK